ncbi:ureidoglycolate lyase [Neptuniibacter halophilus]|uniref:ureidoglycolate lyase n=1 Tax=Neptuniibacter halophilus TaxID=651666 RepID=UPI002573FD17|nr:ureidoglycolate lyase [Neptuniibacter halophilus]
MKSEPDYLNPQIPADLPWVNIPVIVATEENIAPYGRLVDSPQAAEIEIVRWPAQGWRPVDEGTGDEGGTTQGTFFSRWCGDLLYGSNEAVGGHYILGYGQAPELAQEDHQQAPQQLLLWHANYHPDGGQLFFPNQKRPFLVPLALPGDDVQPDQFVCFWFSGEQGLCIHPGIWHEGVFAISGEQSFYDEQGAVHARVSVDFPREFGCLLQIDLSDLPQPV